MRAVLVLVIFCMLWTTTYAEECPSSVLVLHVGGQESPIIAALLRHCIVHRSDTRVGLLSATAAESRWQRFQSFHTPPRMSITIVDVAADAELVRGAVQEAVGEHSEDITSHNSNKSSALIVLVAPVGIDNEIITHMTHLDASGSGLATVGSAKVKALFVGRLLPQLLDLVLFDERLDESMIILQKALCWSAEDVAFVDPLAAAVPQRVRMTPLGRTLRAMLEQLFSDRVAGDGVADAYDALSDAKSALQQTCAEKPESDRCQLHALSSFKALVRKLNAATAAERRSHASSTTTIRPG